jgi:hypothetical protein
MREQVDPERLAALTLELVGAGAHGDVEYMTVGELQRAAHVDMALLGRVLA